MTSSDVGDTKGPQGGAGRADPHPRQRGHRGGRRCAGLYGFAGEAVYCASKFAQVGFAQALDRVLRPQGIKVGVICPGGVKTEFALGKGRTAESVAQSAMLAPEDVAAAVVLACTQAPGSRIIEIQMRPMGEPLA